MSFPTAIDEPAGDRAEPTDADRWAWFAVVAGLVGAGLRVRSFLVDRSLWLDEASLARNVLHRDPGALLEPLSGQQAAPVGYLWILRALAKLFGTSELWLRSPSLVAGIALLPLVWALGRRIASRRAAACAVALVAVSPGLIRYSVEMKQYSIDTAVAVGLLLCAVAVDRRPSLDRLALLMTAAALSIWFSHAAILVVPGIGAYLAGRAIARHDRSTLARLLVVGATSAASLAVLYVTNIRAAADNKFLDDYWRSGFLDHPLRPDHVLAWLWTNTVQLFDRHGGFDLAPLAVVAVVASLVLALARPDRRRSLLVFAVLPVTVVAAAAQLYPYRGRVALYVLPLGLVAMATLVDAPGRLRHLGAIGLVLVAIAPVRATAEQAVRPVLFPEAREVVAYLAAHQEPGQAVVLHGWAKPPFDVYALRHPGLQADARSTWRPAGACDGQELGSLHGEVWFVYAYSPDADGPSDGELLMSHLDALAHRVELYARHDAFVARYDFDAPPDDPGGTHRLVNAYAGCLRVIPLAPPVAPHEAPSADA